MGLVDIINEFKREGLIADVPGDVEERAVVIVQKALISGEPMVSNKDLRIISEAIASLSARLRQSEARISEMRAALDHAERQVKYAEQMLRR